MARIIAFVVFTLLWLPAGQMVRGADWPTFGADAARSGNIPSDRAFSAANVWHLHLRWRVALGEVADTSPIYLSHVNVKGRSAGMLYITAKDGTTYGIDASHANIVWRFTTHGPGITTSTPVADPSFKWVYAPGVDGFVHKLSSANGSEVRAGGFPVRITQMPQTEKDASSLNLANGYLYAATSGYFGDAPPYVGHVVAVRLPDGTSHVWNSLCSSRRELPSPTSCGHSDSGIWSRGGVVVDPDPSMHGRVYAATGNGLFDAGSGGDNYGDSVAGISQDGSHLEDFYTPSTYAELESGDADLGSSSPALLPRQSRSRTPLLAVQGGKDGVLRLLDRQHLGRVGGEMQRVDIGAALFSTPAVWNDGSARTWIYLGLPDGVRAFRLATDGQGKSRLTGAWSATAGQTAEGTSPIVSGGVVFVAMSGAIYALDAQTGRRIWDSTHAGSGGTIGRTHWESPIAINGWLYCSDEDGKVSAYSL